MSLVWEFLHPLAAQAGTPEARKNNHRLNKQVASFRGDLFFVLSVVEGLCFNRASTSLCKKVSLDVNSRPNVPAVQNLCNAPRHQSVDDENFAHAARCLQALQHAAFNCQVVQIHGK